MYCQKILIIQVIVILSKILVTSLSDPHPQTLLRNDELPSNPFGGEWNEDLENFLGWFLQCTGTVDDKTKACRFVYYLRADSDADEWFEDLPDEEKQSWVVIERLFCRKWLKGEVTSTADSDSEIVTTENEPQPASTLPTLLIAASTIRKIVKKLRRLRRLISRISWLSCSSGFGLVNWSVSTREPLSRSRHIVSLS